MKYKCINLIDVQSKKYYEERYIDIYMYLTNVYRWLLTQQYKLLLILPHK